MGCGNGTDRQNGCKQSIGDGREKTTNGFSNGGWWRVASATPKAHDAMVVLTSRQQTPDLHSGGSGKATSGREQQEAKARDFHTHGRESRLSFDLGPGEERLLRPHGNAQQTPQRDEYISLPVVIAAAVDRQSEEGRRSHPSCRHPGDGVGVGVAGAAASSPRNLTERNLKWSSTGYNGINKSTTSQYDGRRRRERCCQTVGQTSRDSGRSRQARTGTTGPDHSMRNNVAGCW